MDIPSDKAILIFDGVCNFCNRSVNFVMKRDRRGRFLFASNQSEAGAALLRKFGVDPASVQSIYLVEGDRLWSKSAAAAQIARRLPFPWNLGYASVIVPRVFRDGVYDWIARNRYRWFGKADSCRLPTQDERSRFL
ncbi:MAG: thiol-disulfide oxidoreductase [Planctomycetota bacterium]|nr:thiol-disulfide oxidoreductase [Planctomycetota bacterium]